jgi:putative ABC transport system permease protein
MISALDRKLLRDVWQMRSQALAISVVIGAGVALFVMARCALHSLSHSKDAYYDAYRFAHVFAQLKRAPLAIVPRIERIDGIARVESRIVRDVTIDVEGMTEPAVGRMISVPDTGPPQLNALYLRRGRWIEPEHEGEVLVSELFAEAHGLNPGDSVLAVLNGQRQRLNIVGIVISPEYLIQIHGALLPDHRRFGVFWMARRQMAAAFDMDGALNDITATLMPGASQDDVIAQIDALLEPYGAVGAYGRDRQVSNQYISDEIRQLGTMAVVAPSIFLGVAAFLLNVVTTRLVGLQREQIAALKAFGYTHVQVGWHYFKLVMLITLLGVVLGTVLGANLGRGMTRMYAEFYRFPRFEIHLAPGVILAAAGIAALAAAVGTWNAVRRAVALPPAEAMRPEPPARFRPTFFERLGLATWLPQSARMILRRLERRPLKAAFSCFGIALAGAVVVMGNFSLDAVRYIMHFQFRLAQRHDLMVSMVEPSSGSALHNFAQLPGVIRAEPFRAVATRLRSEHRWRRVGILGLDSSESLFRLLDVDEQTVPLPDHGLLLSSKLAELLDVGLGDLVTIEVLEGERPTVTAPVTAIITEFGGTNAYMNIRDLNRMLHEGPVLSGAFLAIDPQYRDTLYETLKNTPRVANVDIKSAALETFQQTIAENLLKMRTYNVLFAVVIAFGVVYNSARISLSEQSRELATLRVMGFTRGEVSVILLGELALLVAVAVPLGWLAGYGLVAMFIQGMDTEVYRIPLVIDRWTYAFAGVVVVVAALFSGMVVRRRIDQLDLVGVLKTRE